MQDEGFRQILEDVAKNPTDEISQIQAGKHFQCSHMSRSIHVQLETTRWDYDFKLNYWNLFDDHIVIDFEPQSVMSCHVICYSHHVSDYLLRIVLYLIPFG